MYHFRLHIIAAAIGAAVAMLATPAVAQDNEGLYIGAGIGDFSADLSGLGDLDDADVDLDADDNATKLFVGWRLNRFLAVQADYTDFGESTAAVELVNVTTDTKALTPSVVGTLPIGPIELYGRAGVMFYDVEVDTPDGSLIDNSGEDAVLGAGIGVTLFERFSINAEYTRIDIEELNDADAVWLTAGWRF